MNKQYRWITVLLVMALFCCASCAKKDIAGEQAVAGEQVESSAEEKNPNAQTPSDSTEEQPTEKPEDQPQQSVEEPEKQEPELPSNSMVKRVESNDYSELVRITKGELGEQFDYEIYYYQIENFYIDVDGKEMELRQALKKDPKILDLLYAEWKEDHGDKYLYSDGGTIEYPYETYTAIKMNQMRVSISPEDYSINRDVDKSLILCSSSANLDDVDDRIMLGITDYGFDSKQDQCYKSTVETEPYPPSFVLRKNGRFTFMFSHFSSFAPQGTYTIEGTKLTLQTQGEFDYKYVFEKVDDGWRFIAKESAEIPSFRHGENTEPICPVPDGTIFKIS